MNGAMYLVEMDSDGGKSKYDDNNAGAQYGVGYCDATCPKDVKFVNGQGNPNGKYGSCCSKAGLFEGNSMANEYILHACRPEIMG